MPTPSDTRPESLSPLIVQIRAGHFDEHGAYSAYRRRGTRDHLLIYTRNGCGRFGHARGNGAGGDYVAEPGGLVLLEPGTLHDYGIIEARPRWELVWAHFHPRTDWKELLEFPEIAPGLRALRFTDPELRARIEARLIDVNRLASLPFVRAEALAMNALEEALLWCDLENPVAKTRRLDPRVRRAVDSITSEPKRELSLTELASSASLSRSRFAHLFHEQTGTTPQRYLENHRISRARELLELTERAVAQIAEDLGFSSPFYFSLRFKRATGQSPSAYRKERRRTGGLNA